MSVRRAPNTKSFRRAFRGSRLLALRKRFEELRSNDEERNAKAAPAAQFTDEKHEHDKDDCAQVATIAPAPEAKAEAGPQPAFQVRAGEVSDGPATASSLLGAKLMEATEELERVRTELTKTLLRSGQDRETISRLKSEAGELRWDLAAADAKRMEELAVVAGLRSELAEAAGNSACEREKTTKLEAEVEKLQTQAAAGVLRVEGLVAGADRRAAALQVQLHALTRAANSLKSAKENAEAYAALAEAHAGELADRLSSLQHGTAAPAAPSQPEPRLIRLYPRPYHPPQ